MRNASPSLCWRRAPFGGLRPRFEACWHLMGPHVVQGAPPLPFVSASWFFAQRAGSTLLATGAGRQVEAEVARSTSAEACWPLAGPHVVQGAWFTALLCAWATCP